MRRIIAGGGLIVATATLWTVISYDPAVAALKTASLTVVNIGSELFGGIFGTVKIFGSDSTGLSNVILGEVVNSNPTSTAFPTGVTGAAKVTASGRQAFGLYGFGWLTTPGVVLSQELTAKNTSGNPDVALPPNTAFGTTTNVATAQNITCDVAGTFDCTVGSWIANNALDITKPVFNTGQYIQLYRAYGQYIDAPSTGTYTSDYVANNGNGTNLQLATTGTQVAANSVLTVINGATTYAAIKQNGDFLGGKLTAGLNSTKSISLSGGASSVEIAASSGTSNLFLNPSNDGVSAKLRIRPISSTSTILESVDTTGVGAYEGLTLNGSTVLLASGGTTVLTVASTGPSFNIMPTSAGAGGLAVCVDSAGVLYKKAACP